MCNHYVNVFYIRNLVVDSIIESIPQYTRQRHGSQNNFIYCWNSIYVIGVVFILLHDFNNIIVIHIRFV